MKGDRRIIRRVNVIHELVNGCLGAANLSLRQGIECPLHIPRGQETAIVEPRPAMQMKNESERIGNVPALGESRRDIQILPAR